MSAVKQYRIIITKNTEIRKESIYRRNLPYLYLFTWILFGCAAGKHSKLKKEALLI